MGPLLDAGGRLYGGRVPSRCLGMQEYFRDMPELGWGLGYPLSLVAMAAIDLYLFRRFRAARWL